MKRCMIIYIYFYTLRDHMENLNKWYFKHKYIYNYLHAPLRSIGNIIFYLQYIELKKMTMPGLVDIQNMIMSIKCLFKKLNHVLFDL